MTPDMNTQKNFTKLTDPNSIDITPEDISPDIGSFLRELYLLHGVPFNYLVPEEKMLPVESIRFFYVDRNWINSLLDGAFSIGRFSDIDQAQDQAFSQSIYQSAMPNDTETPITGLLLRSSVVEGWPGLKIEGYTDQASAQNNDRPFPLLRMEQLSSNIILCLFNGVIGYVEIHEPAEGIHFGVDMPDNPDDPQSVFTKELKYLTTDGDHQPGDKISNTTVTVPFRDGGKNVINIKQMAQTIQNNLTDADVFTSAEFALEMVEGVQKVNFTIQNKETAE